MKMIRPLLLSCAAAFLTPSYAALQDVANKGWSYDASTDLAWLDPGLTAGTSFSQLMQPDGRLNLWSGVTAFAVASAGVMASGWRYATSFELQNLHSTNIGGLIGMMGGPTLQGASFSLISGIYDMTPSNMPGTHALFSLHEVPWLTATGVSHAGVHSDTFAGDTRVGNWLVHDNGASLVSPVPEPHEYALMLAGLFAVSWVAKRRRADGNVRHSEMRSATA